MNTSPDRDQSLMGTTHPTAGFVCLVGFFLHIVLSDPLLNMLGFHYSGEDGAFYEKIHPGTLFIFVSFFILVCDRGDPLRSLLRMLVEYPAYLILLGLYVLLFLYVVLRSSPAGTAFLIDTHMTVPICALVLSYAPMSYCRKAAALFLGVAVVNSTVGIVEALGHFRLFSFDPDWSVLHEQYFRASALRGHPLVNATFTSVALFVALAMRWPAVIKTLMALIFIASLFAFGSRSALIFSVIGVTIYTIISFLKSVIRQQPTFGRLLGLGAAAIFVPLGFVALLVVLLNSNLGERVYSAAHWDDSANSRVMAMHVFEHMSEEDTLLGMSGQRIKAITASMNNSVELGGIENPWLLMFLFFGGILFPFWLMATGSFFYRLLHNKPLALKLAIISYIVIASTFNSFGTKDSNYLIMVCAVICAARGQGIALRYRQTV